MKKIIQNFLKPLRLAILGIAAAFLCHTAEAQHWTTNTLPAVAGSSTTNFVTPPFFPVYGAPNRVGYQNLALFTQFVGNAGTNNYILTFAPGVSTVPTAPTTVGSVGVTIANTNTFTVTIANQGGVTNCCYSFVDATNFYAASGVYLISLQAVGAVAFPGGSVVAGQPQ